MTIEQRREFLKGVVRDNAEEMIRQLTAAADDAALDEVGTRIERMAECLTRTET